MKEKIYRNIRNNKQNFYILRIIMGSCSTKNSNQEVPSIKIVTTKPETKSSAETIKEEKNPKEKTPEPINPEEEKVKTAKEDLRKMDTENNPANESEDLGGRRNRKNFTVLATNNDKIDFPKEFGNEKSIIKEVSEGKAEQGSLILVNNPIMFGGRPSSEIQPNFEEKLINIQGENIKRDFLLERGIWVCCKKGLKPESPNQDDFSIVVENGSLILGVFDGHGTHGHEISNFIHNLLPKLLLTHPN